MNGAVYNEIEPFACGWLERLIAAGHIGPGVVERRSIADLTPADVAGPGQRHFFAGIGGWSYALRLAGISDDADIWTGSCPCQPFSDAGKRSGTRDPRHLWPTWFDLIRECRPPTIFGEQVASRDGLAWLDLVRADLEGCGYSFGASDLCAAGVGAPHIRQRLYFVAHAGRQRRQGLGLRVQPGQSRGRRPETGGAAKLAIQLGDASGTRGGRNCGGLSDAEAQGQGEGREPRGVGDEPVDAGAARGMGDAVVDLIAGQPGCTEVDRPEGEGSTGLVGGNRAEHAGAVDALADAEEQRRGPRRIDGAHGRSSFELERLGVSRDCACWDRECAHRKHGSPLAKGERYADGAESRRTRTDEGTERAGQRGAGSGSDEVDWRNAEWIPCTDGVSRPVEPGTFPLAHGVSGRVGMLRGYGNAIVPQVAAVFIAAAIAAREDA